VREATADGKVVVHYDKKGKIAAIEITDHNRALTVLVEGLRIRDRTETRRFYEMLLMRSGGAKKHPEKLIPLEEVA
jgi:uncharacterized protein YuzE